MKNKILNDSIIKTLKPVFQKHKVYLAGGFLRDLILNKSSNDRDLIVSDISPSSLADEIINMIGGTKVLLDNENEIYRVVLKDKINYLDITKPVENDLLKDIERRDFTINSLFFDLNKEEFYDPHNFSDDIKNKKIRTYDLKNLSDDPLRLLRAYRFKALLGFDIENNVKDFIKENGELLNKSAKERINYELVKMFSGDFIVDSLLDMQKIGFLNVIFPIFKEVEKIPPNTHHHLPLVFHLIETVNNIRIKNPYLKIAALLHDIGKPQTWKIEEETGRHRFIGHEKVGAELARPILQELKFSKKQTDYIVKMIQNHIYPSQLMSSEDRTKSAMIRFVKRLYPDIEDVIELARADRLSARGEAVSDLMVKNNLSNLKELLNFYEEIKPTLIDLPKLLDGKEIMKIKDIPQGPKLREIIDALKEAQLLKTVNNKEEAIKFIQEYKFV